MQLRTLFIALLCLSVALIAGCLCPDRQPVAVPPRIVPVDGITPVASPVYHFPFESGYQTVQIDIDPAVYAGARQSDREIHLYKNLSREEWLPIYYLAFINDRAQDRFYSDLLDQFRAIREQEGLDSDRYLELITVFVQSIPYDKTGGNAPPKFPIETYVDGRGDCDDKSLLLAALLSREGYATALLYFDEEEHMAVGVRADGCTFRGTGYAYIETTNISYPGIPPGKLDGGITLHSDPLVIPVGNGTLGYGHCNEILQIREAINSSLSRVEEMEPGIASLEERLNLLHSEITALREDLVQFRTGGGVDRYNRLVREYNTLVEEYNDMISDRNRYIRIYNYLTTHAHDRPGSYSWLQKNMPYSPML
ncbi:MAG: hypothetical protein ACXQTN_00250 [Methanoculleaceae archaeon]